MLSGETDSSVFFTLSPGKDGMNRSVKEQGIDTTQMEMREPPGIFRVLMGVACHEAGHRGTLYTLSRLNGVSLPIEE
jgi:hypothetical protein